VLKHFGVVVGAAGVGREVVGQGGGSGFVGHGFAKLGAVGRMGCFAIAGRPGGRPRSGGKTFLKGRDFRGFGDPPALGALLSIRIRTVTYARR
jgi:hypothetical protein